MNFKIRRHRHRPRRGRRRCRSPRCGAAGPDSNYPHAAAAIGVWGYDVTAGASGLKPPGTFDYMSYCVPMWVSVYFFAKSLDHLSRPGRGVAAFQAQAQAEDALILWGNIQDGRLLLEPPLALEAPVKRPERSGPYTITALDRDGRTLFSFDFAPNQTDHGGETFLSTGCPVDDDRRPVDGATAHGHRSLRAASLRAAERDPIQRVGPRLLERNGELRSILRDWSGNLPAELDGLPFRRLRERR